MTGGAEVFGSPEPRGCSASPCGSTARRERARSNRRSKRTQRSCSAGRTNLVAGPRWTGNVVVRRSPYVRRFDSLGEPMFDGASPDELDAG